MLGRSVVNQILSNGENEFMLCYVHTPSQSKYHIPRHLHTPLCLDGTLNETDLHEAVVDAPKKQQQSHQKCADVHYVHSSFLICHRVCSTCYPDADTKDNEAKEKKNDGSASGKFRSNTRHFPAMWTSCQCVVEGVEKKRIMTMCTCHTAHTWNVVWGW